MPEIREEIMIFFTAVLTGAVLRTAYRCISCLREWIRHEPVAIELEDLFYWIAASIYFFVQIYHHLYGKSAQRNKLMQQFISLCRFTIQVMVLSDGILY